MLFLFFFYLLIVSIAYQFGVLNAFSLVWLTLVTLNIKGSSIALQYDSSFIYTLASVRT